MSKEVQRRIAAREEAKRPKVKRPVVRVNVSVTPGTTHVEKTTTTETRSGGESE